MEQFREAHYFHIPSQGNIYTLTEIKLANGNVIILVASLKREIYCFEYLESPQGGLVSTSKEVPFTYIPSGAEIISMDAFNKSTVNNELVIGITIIKNSNDSNTLETFLNIYSQLEENEDFNIKLIAQNCLTVELSFIPYKLMHTYLITWMENEMPSKELVFVLSGSDNQVHIFHENASEHIYKEMENKEKFPEFGKTPSPIVWIDICHMNNYTERITAFGCECGYVKLLKVNTKTNKVLYNFSTRFGNYISNVCLYFEQEINNSEILKLLIPKGAKKKETRPILNLVVVNSILPAVLFEDVLKYGLSNYYTLPRHDDCTIFTSCIVADIDFNNKKEILISSSSEEILLYKFDETEKQWFLEELKHFIAPVFSMKYVDLSRDGVKDLIVFSMKGLHILQHDHSYVQKMLSKKIDALTIPELSSCT